jgi:hypothetical protein
MSNDAGVKKDTTVFTAYENPHKSPVSSPVELEDMVTFELTV